MIAALIHGLSSNKTVISQSDIYSNQINPVQTHTMYRLPFGCTECITDAKKTKRCFEVSLSPRFLVLHGNTECVKTWYWDIKVQRLLSQAVIQIQTQPKAAIPHTDLIWTMHALSCYCRICIRVCISVLLRWTSNFSLSVKWNRGEF